MKLPWLNVYFVLQSHNRNFRAKLIDINILRREKKIYFEDKILLWNGDHCTNSTPYNLTGKHKNADWQHFPGQTIGDSGINLQRYINSHASPSHWMQTFPFKFALENSFLPSLLLPHLFYLKAVFGSLVFSWHFKQGSKQLIWKTVKLTWYQS